VHGAWHFHVKGQYYGEVTEAFCKNGHHKLSVPQQHSAHSVTMVKKIQHKHVFMVPRQFSTVTFTYDTDAIFFLLKGVDSFSITDPFSGFRFCVINHVSAPQQPSLISVTCQIHTRKAHTMSFVIICGILWHPVYTHFSLIQLVTDNSVHYPSNV